MSHVDDPDLGQSLTQLGMIENIEVEGLKVSFDLVLTTPACPMKSKMHEDCINAIHEYVDRNAEVEVRMTSPRICFRISSTRYWWPAARAASANRRWQ